MDTQTGKRSERRKLIPVVVLTISVILLLYLPGILNATLIPKIRRRTAMKRLKKQDVEIGDVLVFGEEIWTNTWRVLDVDGSKVLLINEKCVEFRGFTGEVYDEPFHASWGMGYPPIAPETPLSSYNVWENSGIKKWLNNEYYTYAFSDAEKALITDRGLGMVFLLSSDEAEVYFPQKEDRIPGGRKDKAPWWLRSGIRVGSGKYEGEVYAEYVSYDCAIRGNYICFNSSMLGIRPAIWLELDPDGE